MSVEARDSHVRTIRLMLLTVGALLFGYAISDHPFYGGEPGFGRLQGVIAAVGVGIAACAALPRRFAERVLIVAVASLAMLAFAEIAGEFILGPRNRPIFQTDGKLIFKLIPNRSSVMTRSQENGGASITHRINSDGFRGAELMPPGTAPRVVVYGDSFIHATYMAEKETFSAVLGDLLSARIGTAVEVINAGVSSYGPDQISVKMEAELPRLRPELAIIAIYAGNDYGDLMRNKMFKIDSNDNLIDNEWRLDPGIRNQFEFSQRESILVRSLRVAMRSFRLSSDQAASTAAPTETSQYSRWSHLLQQSDREYKDYVVDRNNVVTNTHIDYYSANISLLPDSESARYEVRLMQAVLGRIRDVAAKNGVPLFFVFIPHPADVATSYDDWSAVDLKRYPGYLGRNQTAPLENGAKSAGVPFISLYDAYRAVDANRLYFPHNDDHWNAAGQRMAAELVSEQIASTLVHRRDMVKSRGR